VRHFATLDPLDVWFAILLGHVTRCTLSVLRFRQGRWRQIEVGIHRRVDAESR
jgi:Na+-driven multidrug efflux pump